MAKYLIGLTGASGSIYADKLVRELLALKQEVYFIATHNGKNVYAYELERTYAQGIDDYQRLAKENDAIFLEYDNADMFAPVASGSVKMDGVIIVPCSMGTLGKVANGISDSLITRSIDVAIKERRQLILVTRETPLSSIHLENMLKVSNNGGVIMPPVPAFYAKPKSLEESIHFSVGRMIEMFGIPNSLHYSWGSEHA